MTTNTLGTNRFGLKEVCDVTLYSLATNNPVVYMDTLKMSDIENKATTVYAQGGRGNPYLMGWDFDRQATIKIQDALMSLSSLSLLAGNAVVNGANNIFQRDVLTVVAATSPSGSNQVTLTQTPVTNSTSLWVTPDGGKTITTQIADFTAAAGVLTFPTTDAAVGAEVVAFYQYNTPTASSLLITSDSFPGYYKIVGDTVVRDEETGVDQPLQIVIPKAKLDATFTLTLQPDGKPTVLDFTLSVFKDPDNTEMIQLIRY
jgi:hypothetical protein